MSQLFEKFMKKFKEEYPSIIYKSEEYGSGITINPPASSGFQNLCIMDHDFEITVYLGQMYHQHFSLEEREVKEEVLIDDILDFIRNIISNKFKVENYYRGDTHVKSYLVDCKTGQKLSEVGFILPLVLNFFKPQYKKDVYWSDNGDFTDVFPSKPGQKEKR
jgi:hypothetical protein